MATGQGRDFNGSVDVIADVVGYYEPDAAAKPISGFGGRQGVSLKPPAIYEVANLSDGSGPVTLTVPSRVVVTGAVTIGNQAGTGQFSIISCQLEIDNGAGFAPIGLPQGSESIGNSNHDETYNVALTAATDQPAGTYDLRITCQDTFQSATSSPISRNASLTVVALPA